MTPHSGSIVSMLNILYILPVALNHSNVQTHTFSNSHTSMIEFIMKQLQKVTNLLFQFSCTDMWGILTMQTEDAFLSLD